MAMTMTMTMVVVWLWYRYGKGCGYGIVGDGVLPAYDHLYSLLVTTLEGQHKNSQSPFSGRAVLVSYHYSVLLYYTILLHYYHIILYYTIHYYIVSQLATYGLLCVTLYQYQYQYLVRQQCQCTIIGNRPHGCSFNDT